MKKLFLAAAAATLVPFAAQAQEAAPDGTPAFGIEPYAGIGGAYHDFDSSNHGEFNLNGSAKGWLIDGFAGINVPLGPVVVGVEGQASYGFDDIEFEYGATGHIGFRAGDSGMIFARAGYRWIEGDGAFNSDKNEIYGVGVEVGPSDIGLGGITGNSGARLRLVVDTYDLQSIRPSAAVVFHF
jgi:outer membrane immunogenic protein